MGKYFYSGKAVEIVLSTKNELQLLMGQFFLSFQCDLSHLLIPLSPFTLTETHCIQGEQVLTYKDHIWDLPGGLVVRNPPANAGDVGLIPGSGRSLGGGDGNPLPYSCLENSMDRGAWWATGSMGSQNETPLRD